MDLKKKYLKYKNKYLSLKYKMNGGREHRLNFCLEDEKINIDSLHVGEIIEFMFEESGVKTNFKFYVKNSPGETDLTDKVLIESMIKNITGEPILQILLNKKDSYTKLYFVRTLKPNYTLMKLIHIYACVTKYFNFTKMILEDSANFTFEDVTYVALFYRIFTGKDSLYNEKIYEFKPHENDDFYFKDEKYTDEKYLIDKQLLYNSKLSDYNEFYDKVKDIINENYKYKLTFKPDLSKPYILEQIDDIQKSINNFGLDNYTRDYVERLNNGEISVKERKIIKIFMEKLMFYKGLTGIYEENMKNIYMFNPLYAALQRIYKSHQFLESTNVKCVFCS